MYVSSSNPFLVKPGVTVRAEEIELSAAGDAGEKGVDVPLVVQQARHLGAEWAHDLSRGLR